MKAARNRAKRIIGGETAGSTQFAYQAQIRIKRNKEHLCSGTIISEEHILTAAHCLSYDEVNKRHWNPDTFQVVVGTHTRVDRSGVLRELLEYYLLEKYDPHTGEGDIAIVEVRK